MQFKRKDSKDRFYGPERDILNFLPRLIGRALTDAGYEDSEAMMNVSKALLAHTQAARNPKLSLEEVIAAHKAHVANLNTKEYQAFLHHFLLVMLDFYTAALRQVPESEGDGDRDERILLEFHNWVLQYRRWPWWRRGLYNLKKWWYNLASNEPDTETMPIMGSNQN